LRLRDVRNTWNLSNLSNTCPTTSPTDKDPVIRGSGVDVEFGARMASRSVPTPKDC